MVSKAVKSSPQTARTSTAWLGLLPPDTGWKKPPIICSARRQNRKDPTVHDHLGDVYFKQGKIPRSHSRSGKVR